MQTLGNFATTTSDQSPVFVAIMFDATTRLPSFALVQESPTDVPIIYWGAYAIETRGLLQDCEVVVTRPQGDGGIIRRTCTLEVQTEHSKGYAYFHNQLTKALYYGGQNVQDVYFGLYAVDRQFILNDIKDALFLGYYQLETGVEWTEGDGKTSIPLTEILTNDTTIVGATTETVPESFFLFNPWFTGQVIPKVFGQVPRIKMLNSFPTISVKTIAGSINGLVQADYTSSATTIILEANTDQSSVLRQLAAVGGFVRIKMANGEVIRGTLVYNSVTNQVSMTVVTRNTYYAKAKGYTYVANGETPTDWGFDLTYQKKPAVWANDASILLHGKELIQDPDGWMQASVDYYLSPTTHAFETSATQMKGWVDEEKGIIKHGLFTNAAATSTTLLSFRFYFGGWASTQNGSADPTTYAWPPAEFLYFAGSPIDVNLFFIDPATTVVGGHAGDAWQLVGYEPASISYECYIRNGFSHFLSTNIYAEGEGRLIRIPAGKITSVTDSTTVDGLANMAKVVLTAAPVDMDIGATSNNVYIDAVYRTGTDENRTERILYEILKESTLLQNFAGGNITGTAYSSTNWLPYIGYIARGDENISDVLDKICFQCGAAFKWVRDKFWLRAAAYPTGAEVYETISSVEYVRPTVSATDQSEMMENTARIGFGKLNTAIDSEGFEYIPMYLDVEYGAWEDPYYKPAKQIIQRAIKPNERRVTAKFDLINDASSAKYAIGLFLSIGHPSGATQVQRTISTEMILHGCRWEACDPILFKDFPLLSTADETNAYIDEFGRLLYERPSDHKRFLMGALGVVEQVTYQFNIDKPKVVLSAKMSQAYTEASGAAVYNPPYPPAPPNTPSNNPANPPGGSGGGNGTVGGGGGHSFGGYGEPMELSVTGSDPDEIDSTDPKTSTITVTVEEGTGSKGFTWYAAIEDDYGTGGATISPSAGSFGDKTSDAYIPGSYACTLSVSYTFMYPFPHDVTREIRIKFTRVLTNADGTTSLDFQYHNFTARIHDLTDIDAS